MTLPREVRDELLDGLAATDPAAMRSRRDLQRVHSAMGSRSILVKTLRRMLPPPADAAPVRILELGAGDGALMLGVARALAPQWPRVELTLLDRLALVDDARIASYGALGWTARAWVIDVLDWAGAAPGPQRRAPERWDLIIAHLFLHHFEAAQLARLLEAIAERTDRLFACEPRRGWFEVASSHLIGALGVNAVTRTDAVLSVHAGFRGNELTALWPRRDPAWRVQEYAAGLFSHCFRAERARRVDAN